MDVSHVHVQVSIADRVPDYHPPPPLMIGGGQHDLLVKASAVAVLFSLT